MRALVVTDQHRSDGLDLTEIPVPVPASGEVTIDVEVAGIGLIDALWATGAMPSGVGFVPGLEVAGTIRELGDGVSGFAVGQRVAAILTSAGGFAEVACARASLVAGLPSGLRTDSAAVVPVNTVTAHLALTTVARFSRGETMLVHAGVGGLGSQFAQVARALGAGRIDAVVGTPAKQKIARDLGYDDAYLRSDLAAIPADAYDLVVDPVGGDATATGFRALRSGGRLVRVGNASQAPDVAISSMAHWLENKTTAGFNVGAWLGAHPEQGTSSLRWALDAVANGEIRVELSRVGDPEQIAELLASLEQGLTTGKVAIRMQPNQEGSP